MRRVSSSSRDYPPELRALGTPELEWRGASLGRPRVAIVGSRRASESALTFTHEVARALAGAGAWVISGGAFGVDAAAHRGALDAGGRTAAVVIQPVANPPPRSHRALFDEIAERGAIIARLDLPARRAAFVERNKVVAALADHVVVVRAGRGSGSASTAAFANALKRPLWVVPGAPWESGTDGILDILQSGAQLLTGPAPLASALGLNLGPRDPQSRTLCARPMTLEEIRLATGWSAEQVSRWVSEGELQGRLVRRAGRIVASAR